MTDALVLIDVQQGFDDPVWGDRNNPGAESTIERLLEVFRSAGEPVFHVQHAAEERHSPLRPDRPGFAFKPCAEPVGDEPVFEKSTNGAFAGSELAAALHDRGVERPVFVGFTAEHCVSTTVREAENFGFDPVVVADATVSFDREGHDGRHYPADRNNRLALAHLQGEFAEVLEADDVIATLD